MILWFYQLSLFVIDLIYFLWKAILLCLQSVFSIVFPPPKKSVNGEIILITGGGHGLGRELAILFAKHGAQVVVWDINEELNRQTAEDIKTFGGSAYAYRCDVSSREDVAKVAQQVKEDVGYVTMLINNAGILHCRPLLMLNHQQIQRTMEVNTMAHFWTIREFLPSMIEMKKGHIVCISSLAGRVGFPNLTDYCASKFAVAGLMTSLCEEMRFYKHSYINFTTVHPVIINTGMAHKPRVKHPWLCPILETADAAQAIVDSILRNEKLLYLPRASIHVWRLIQSFPLSVQEQFNDFLGSGLDAHDG